MNTSEEAEVSITRGQGVAHIVHKDGREETLYIKGQEADVPEPLDFESETPEEYAARCAADAEDATYHEAEDVVSFFERNLNR